MREVRSYARSVQGGKRVATPLTFGQNKKKSSHVAEQALSEIDWGKGRCRQGDPDAMFVQSPDEQRLAARICRGCPIKVECLADALDNRIEFGVWGGMIERQRRALLRRHPQVSSWRRMFAAARARRIIA